jgi:hypothetical protein
MLKYIIYKLFIISKSLFLVILEGSLHVIFTLAILKKPENSEFQPISTIFPRDEASCLKVLHLFHLGGNAPDLHPNFLKHIIRVYVPISGL